MNIPNKAKVMMEVRISNPNNNPTYLHSALYEVTRHGQTLEFRNAFTGSGTSERIPMFEAFAKQGRIEYQIL